MKVRYSVAYVDNYHLLWRECAIAGSISRSLLAKLWLFLTPYKPFSTCSQSRREHLVDLSINDCVSQKEWDDYDLIAQHEFCSVAG